MTMIKTGSCGYYRLPTIDDFGNTCRPIEDAESRTPWINPSQIEKIPCRHENTLTCPRYTQGDSM